MESLVKGGVLGGQRYDQAPPRQFITSTPLVVTKKTRIVAVASPSELSGNPAKDGWFLSDFYALNYLYRGQGASQTWLTAADPLVLLQKYGNFLHGNPYQERKVVLSKELIKNGELTKPDLVKPSQMNERFSHEIRKAAQAAVKDDGNVLLLVFCHGLKKRFILDDSLNSDDYDSSSSPTSQEMDDGEYFTVKHLKEAAGPHVRLTLVTTACYSGGWLVHPSLNVTGMAAAPPDYFSNSWIASNSIGRACGSMFVSSLVRSMTSTASKLLPDEERIAPDSTDDKPKRLQPENPTQAQSLTYNSFCNTMMDVLGRRLYRNVHWQEFTFSAQGDAWEASWTGLTGMELAEYEQRWDKLATYAYEGPQSKKDNLDPSPLNTTFQAAGQGGRGLERTGGRGGSRSAEMEDLMTRVNKRRVRQLAKLFRKTCPGDESTAREIPVMSMLRECAETGNPQPNLESGGYMKYWNLFAVVQYRIDLGRLADSLVDAFHLPRPDDAECLMWDSLGPQGRWVNSFGSTNNGTRSVIDDWLLNRLPSRTKEQGPIFWRFKMFLRTALLMANKDPATTRQIAEQINAAVAEARASNEKRLLADPEVRQRGRDWVRSIGRRVRESLSPKKRPAPPSGPRRSIGQGESSASVSALASSSRQDPRRLGQERPSSSRQDLQGLPSLSLGGSRIQGGHPPPASAIFASSPSVLHTPHQSSRAPFHMEAMQHALDDDGAPGGGSTRPGHHSGQEGDGKGKEKEVEHPADNQPNFW